MSVGVWAYVLGEYPSVPVFRDIRRKCWVPLVYHPPPKISSIKCMSVCVHMINFFPSWFTSVISSIRKYGHRAASNQSNIYSLFLVLVPITIGKHGLSSMFSLAFLWWPLISNIFFWYLLMTGITFCCVLKVLRLLLLYTMSWNQYSGMRICM